MALCKLLNSDMKSLLSSTPISDEYEQIKSIISKKVDKPILIFIDDVDRLEKEELSALLKLIRNTADFPKLFYIIAADDTYLKDMGKRTPFTTSCLACWKMV